MPVSVLRQIAIFAVGLAWPAAAGAAPQLPNGADTVEALPMLGPFASLDDYCKSQGEDVQRCLAPAPECGAPKGLGKLAGPFTEARILEHCDVALHAPKGWFVLSTTGLPAWAMFLNNGDRYQSELTSFAPSADHKSILVRGLFVHATSAEKMPWLVKPPTDTWLECEDRLFVCQLGDTKPGCAGPFPVAFTAYCRDAEHPTRALRRAEPHDFRFVPGVMDMTLTMHAASAKQPRKAPLPGWAVLAIDAASTLGTTRDLSPEHVTLKFP